MRLEISNLGKIETANVKLDGITVIAGENNTGKSTIGKMLYCLFCAFYKVEEKVRSERVKSVSKVLDAFEREVLGRMTGEYDYSLAKRIVDSKDLFRMNKARLESEIKSSFIKQDKSFEEYLEADELTNTAGKICQFLDAADSEIQKILLRRRLDTEFAMNLGHVNYKGRKTRVKLSIKNNGIEFEATNNEEITILQYMSLNKNIVYMDDPFVLDQLDRTPIYFFHKNSDHQEDLLRKVLRGKRTEEFSAVDELFAQKKLDKIFSVMQNACDGELITDDHRAFVYKSNRLKGNLNIVNLSTGMKSFAMMRHLLKNGTIEENGILILDEPEIHLHPAWQLSFAEVIVLIQKEFHANILLNTHSPYFLNAIEVYSKKYGIADKCKYYLAEEEGDVAHIVDVTDQTDQIYEKLAKPLQDLENLEYANDSE